MRKERIFIKKERPFLGLLLIGVGAYIFLSHWHLQFLDHWTAWPNLLILIGAVFLLFAWLTKEFDLLFPAFLLLGIGCNPYLSNHFKWWPKQANFYSLLIGLGFLIRYYRFKKTNFLLGLILIVLAFFQYVLKAVENQLHAHLVTLDHYWPLILVAVGAFLYLKKK
jgi:hypothetical protein